MNGKTALRALGAAAAAGLAIGLAGTAQAEAGFDNGPYYPDSHQEFAGCVGDLQSGTPTGDGWTLYARGMFILNTSTRGLRCHGYLQRSADGGRTWNTISSDHVGTGGVHEGTSYYYDEYPYLSRICVGDYLYYNSYSCGRPGALGY